MSLLLVSVSLFSIPGKNEVEKAVADEINRQIKDNENSQYWMNIFENLFESIFRMKRIKDVFFVILIFSACCLVFLLFFFLFRNISSVNFRARKTYELETKHESAVFEAGHLDGLINEGKFSEAVVYIHRCSVFYLIKRQLIYNANLTNFSIYAKIEDNVLKDSFRRISDVSEKVLFDEYEAVYDDAESCKKIFAENFV